LFHRGKALIAVIGIEDLDGFFAAVAGKPPIHFVDRRINGISIGAVNAQVGAGRNQKGEKAKIFVQVWPDFE
jgi:hypothetical protein